MSRYEIALSFAGEDRTYVEMVARFLQSHGVSFFYDDYNDVNLWGKDLYAHLVEVYSKAERYVIIVHIPPLRREGVDESRKASSPITRSDGKGRVHSPCAIR